MALVAYDDFNRADSGTMGMSPSGHTWVEPISYALNMRIASNSASCSVSGNNMATLNCGEANGIVRVTVASVSGTQRCGLIFRNNNNKDYWRFFRHADGKARLDRWINDGSGVTYTQSTTNIVSGDRLAVEMQGDLIKCSVNSTQVFLVTDATHNTHGYHGIQCVETGSTLDDWEFETNDAPAGEGPSVSASRYDLDIEQGAAFSLYMTWLDENGAAVNLTGYRVRLQIRAKVKSSTTLLDFDSASLAAGMTLGTALGATGVIDIQLSAAVTAALTFQDTAHYDLIVISAGGWAGRLLEGRAVLGLAVTR